MVELDELEVYRGRDGQWYWHRTAANGRHVSDSGEGFTRKFSAKRAARRANRDTENWRWA
jgi:uncharacterized protein YegP (UPF0339 family)